MKELGLYKDNGLIRNIKDFKDYLWEVCLYEKKTNEEREKADKIAQELRKIKNNYTKENERKTYQANNIKFECNDSTIICTLIAIGLVLLEIIFKFTGFFVLLTLSFIVISIYKLCLAKNKQMEENEKEEEKVYEDKKAKREKLAQYKKDYEQVYKKYQAQNEVYLGAAEKLKSLYSRDIIHPNYRNWSAVVCIYNYIDEGRCNTLSGPHGAYNLYKLECMGNNIAANSTKTSNLMRTILTKQYDLERNISELK